MPTQNPDILHLLRLLSIDKVGSTRIRHLVARFGSAESALIASPQDLAQVNGIDEETAGRIHQADGRAYAEEQLVLSEKHQIKILSFWDSAYPERLKTIFDPPVLLFIRGEIDALSRRSMAIVGTRRPSEYGRKTAEKLAGDLTVKGIQVISGMARGIDTRAHWGALRAGGSSVAVLGSGVDVIYPAENQNLADRLAEQGAVISEFPLKSEPLAHHFPKRNRIISGLTAGTVVVEAGQKSGALITAFYAMDQGREVFAVPGPIQSQRSRGPHRLIKEGAKLIENVEDILSEFSSWISHDNQEESSFEPKGLTSDEETIWTHLTQEPVHIDSLAQAAERPTSDVLPILLSLELKGIIRQMPGMMFMRRK